MIRGEDLHGKIRWTPYEGLKVKARALLVDPAKVYFSPDRSTPDLETH